MICRWIYSTVCACTAKLIPTTDTHPVVLALKQQFPKSIRRYSGIVLDIYFDHLLMQHWQQFSAIDVKKHTLFNQFYHDLALLHHDISPHFSRVKTGLLRHQWLDDYEQLDACSRAMETVEKRFTRPTEFAQQAMGFIHENSAGLQQSFYTFIQIYLGTVRCLSVNLLNRSISRSR
ncbi:ACP phosphodiesterase [Paraglaciecola sp. Hal342]